MARYIPVGTPVNKSEEEGLRQLRDILPEHYIILGNFELQLPRRRNTMEFDAVVLGDEGVYAVEIKGWSGKIKGDVRRWELDWGRVENPFIRTETKAKALRDVLARRVLEWPHELCCEAVVYLTGKRVDVQTQDPRNERLVRTRTLEEFFTNRTQRWVEDERVMVSAALKNRIVDALVPLARPVTRMAVIPNYEVEGELVRPKTPYREFVGRHLLLRSRKKVRIKAYALDPLLAPTKRHSMIQRVVRDMEVLNTMEHNPYVARAYELIRDLEDELVFYIVGEWVGSMTLEELFAERMRQGEQVWSVHECWRHAVHLIKAVLSMHEHETIHRNLHPGVIYLVNKKGAKVEGEVPLKIADFDFARVDALDSIAGDLKQIGTEGYVAPELWLNDTYDQRVDVFSMGAILFELISGEPLYDDMTSILKHNEIWARKRKCLPDDACREVFGRLLAYEPSMRVSSCVEVLPFFEERLSLQASEEK